MNHDARLLREALRSELPAGLAARIEGALLRARTRRERLCHAVRMLCASLSLISFAGLFVSVRELARAASASGFTSYASLAISDSSVVVAHSDSFLASLAESLPSTETAVFLALVSVFLVSLRSAVAYGLRAERSRIRIA
jgi:cellulose synthase/poly-beta-1,6-N-acetylglucosamine synthase-like glycosyltransferase